MIRKIKDFFNSNIAPEAGEKKETDEKRLQVATCALFLEMAKMDDEFSDDERERILSILKKEFGLTDERAEELIGLAELELKASVDLWQFTNLINDAYSPEEKVKIMEMIWRVVYADGHLDKHEDYLVKKLTKLLNLRHREMIDAKLRVLGRK